MDVLERLKAALADRYRIERELGAGGMATVYLAEDIKHDRKVALKVLKPELAAVLGAERFVVEIKTTAALQHPHILPLFDSGEADGFLYYVMPFIQGETLRAKLDRETQFSVDEAVRITTQVADALDYAHRHGVIHRDIKPENILLHDGRPMVADFGIALALSAAAGGRMTETGLSLGTPHYMSPEQATAEKEITGRADVYSLASVLYEMLTGNPPHTGATAQQIIMKIIVEPVEAVTKFRKSVPPNVAAAVAKALEKLPADRFESAKAFSEALLNSTWTSATFVGGEGAPLAGVRGVMTRPFLAVSAIAAVATLVAGWALLRPATARPVARFGLLLPDSQQLNQTVNGTRLALSPDGRTIVYVGGGSSQESQRLWVRPLDQLRATPLAGTERAVNPAFSPDGKRIAYVSLTSPRALRVVPVAGGPVLTLTDSLVDLGGVSWGADGYIYYDGHLEGDGVARIRESGGKPEVASRPDSADGELYHHLPAALPNGRGLLFTIARQRGGAGRDIAVLDTRTGKHRVLVRGALGRYAESGHLLFVTEDGMLMAAPFDADALRLTGEAVLVEAGLSVRGNQRIDLATSHDGTIVYAAGETTTGRRELVWVERDGTAHAVDSLWSGEMAGRPVLSPDGRMAAVTMGRGTGRPVWVKQLDRGAASRVAEVGANPSWSPDGKTLVFSATGGGAFQRVPADGSALPSPMQGAGVAPSLSSDGKWLLFNLRGDIVGIRTDGDTAQRMLVADPVTQTGPVLSPDGRWLAYSSDEAGSFQVYVRPFPDTKVAKRQVSIAGGYAPRWSRSGREIFYIDYESNFWVAEIAPGAVFASGTPRRLFSADAYGPLSQHQFDVSPDGRRFLFSRAVAGAEGRNRGDELVVVQNFFSELKAKVPR